MKKVVLIALTLTINSFLFAVDKKYIPNNSDSVFSINFGTLSEKAEIDLQKVFNKLFMQRYADRYLEFRDDEFVAEVMTNKLHDYIDFSKTSRVIFLNNYQEMAVLFDVKNISELDRLMIKMASQEDKLVSVSDNAKYRYFELDQYNFISWNNEVFAILLKLKDNYWYNEELNSNNHLTNNANLIFLNENPITEEKFSVLDTENNDISIWANLSLLSDPNIDFTKFLFGRYYNDMAKNTYKDSLLTAKINFNNGNADIMVDSYTPNYPYDTTALKKELADSIYQFVEGKNNYGFLSLAFNSEALSQYMKEMFKDFNNFPLKEELEILEEYGIDTYKLIELLGGDIFLSVWDNNIDDTERIDPVTLVSASITDVDTVKIILEALAEDSTNDVYTIAGYSCYIKDSILYIASYSSIIDSIINNEIPEMKIPEDRLNLAKNNTVALYLEFSPNLYLYGIDEYTEALESLYFTSNILENNHTQMNLKINMNDKEKNALTIIKSLFDL